MNKLTSPHCKTLFEVDEQGYSSLIKQVRDEQFEKELDRVELAANKEKIPYYLGDFAGGLNLQSSLSREEWSASSDVRKVAAVDTLVYLSLFAKGLVE